MYIRILIASTYDQGYLQHGVPKTTEKLQSLVYNKVCFSFYPSKINTR